MNLKELLQEHNKIIPFRKILPLFILLGVMIIISIVLNVTEDSKHDAVYLKLSINGEMSQIVQRGIYVYGEIDQEWYELYDEIISIAKVGDSIMKDRNSHDIVINRRSESIRVATGDVLLVKLSKEEYYKVAD